MDAVTVALATTLGIGLALIVIAAAMASLDPMNKHPRVETGLFVAGIVLIVGAAVRFGYVAWHAHRWIG